MSIMEELYGKGDKKKEAKDRVVSDRKKSKREKRERIQDKKKEGFAKKEENKNFEFKPIYIVGLLIVGGIIYFMLFGGNESPSDNTPSFLNDSTTDQNASPVNESNSRSKPEDITIKVIKFEPNKPCASCTNLGNFAKETIEKHFPEDYKSGKITYQTVNYQDPKNRQLLEKYNVMGSSLYITVIKDGEEEIIDANDMWDYVWKQEEYTNIFKNKLEAIKK